VYVLGDIFIILIVIVITGFPEQLECNRQACFLLTFTKKRILHWNLGGNAYPGTGIMQQVF
jgi:hypothetical protein